MMNYVKMLFSSLILIGLSSACYYDNKEDLYQNFDQNTCDTASVTYRNDIKMIIGTSCAIAGCHLGQNATQGLDLSQFSEVKRIADNGQLVGRITGSTGALMPPGGALPKCEIEQIKAWVSDGAQEN